MAGYIGSKAVSLSTTAADVTGDAEIGGDLTVDTNTLYVDSTNNRVGIKTTSPVKTLHLNETAGINAVFHMTNATTGATDTDGFSIISQETSNDVILSQREAANLVFKTSNTERMRIDSNGNLLVGKTTTGSGTDGFEARSNGFIATSRDDDIVATINRNTSNGDIVQFRKDNTTVGSIGATSATHLHVGSGDTGLLFQGSANAVEPWNISTNGPRDDTIDLGLTSNRFRKAYLGQNVFVRTTSLGGFVASAAIQSNGGTGHGAAFQTDATSGFAAACFSRNSNNGAVQEFFYNVSSSAVGTITITSSATSYNTSSDHRLKENVETLSSAISRVKQLQPKRFSWIVDNEDSATVDGFLAHEAQTVVPEAVTGAHNEVDADGNPVYQGIDQSKLVPLLTAALKESIAKIETLETEMTSVKARLDALEAE